MKLPNKTGTVYKLAGKRRNPWIARAYQGKDEFGRRVYQTIGYFRTKTDATRSLLEYTANPYDINKKNLTFKAVFDIVVQEKKKDVKPATINNNYINAYNNFFKSLENRIFSDLRPYDYQKVFDYMAFKGRKASYLARGTKLLKVIYQFAIVNDIVSVDYSKGIVNRGTKSEPQPFFTESELKHMIEEMDKTKDADIPVILCLTGLRPAELIQIRRENVDLESKILRNVGIKTAAGKRKRIPISDIIYPYIKKRYDKSADYLFTKEGHPMNYQTFLIHIYKPVMEQLGIEGKTPKACRHTFANITFGILEDKTRITIMGHTDKKTTDTIYTDIEDHKLYEQFRKVTESLTKV